MTADKLLVLSLYLLPLMLAVFVAQSVRLRVQNLLAARPDPQLGRKAVLHLFLSVSIVTGLAGVTVSAADLLTRAFEPFRQAQAMPAPAGPVVAGPWFSPAQRAAVALAIAGLFHGTLFAVVLRVWTNDRDEPAVRRAHIGTRLVFAGMIWMIADTAGLLILFAEGNTAWDDLAVMSAFGLVWGPTAAVHLWLLLGDRRRPAADPAD